MKRLYVQFFTNDIRPSFSIIFLLELSEMFITFFLYNVTLSLSNYKTKLFELLFQINRKIPDNRTITVDLL